MGGKNRCEQELSVRCSDGHLVVTHVIICGSAHLQALAQPVLHSMLLLISPQSIGLPPTTPNSQPTRRLAASGRPRPLPEPPTSPVDHILSADRSDVKLQYSRRGVHFNTVAGECIVHAVEGSVPCVPWSAPSELNLDEPVSATFAYGPVRVQCQNEQRRTGRKECAEKGLEAQCGL